MTFKALRGDTPRYLSDLFVPSRNDTYYLRSNDRKLHTEIPNTNLLKKVFHTAELYPGIAFLVRLSMYTTNSPCLLLKP